MKILPILFICVEIFGVLFYKKMYYLLNYFLKSLKKPQEGDKPILIVVDEITIVMIFFYLLHFVFLFYCIYLMFSGLWEPASMLLLLSVLESYAVRSGISGVTYVAADSNCYPRPLLKYGISAFTIFILLNLMS